MAAVEVGPRRPDRETTGSFGRWVGRLRASSPLRTVAVAGILLFGLVVAGTVFLMLELRSREIKDARRELLNVTAALAEAASRSFQNVDLVLASLVEELSAERMTSPGDFRARKADRATHEILRGRVAGLPQLNALSLVGIDGRVVNFSRSFPVPDISLADRAHFAALLADGTPEPFLSEPVNNRGTGEWSVYLARRVKAPDGTLIGLVYAAIELRYFESIFGSLDLGRDASLSLWTFDGTLLVRHPALDGVGRRFDTPSFRELGAASQPFAYETPVGIDGQSRLVARRVVPGFPTASVASRTMAEVLADWRWQGVVLAVLGILLATAVLVATVALARQMWAYEEVARAVAARSVAVQGLQDVEAQLRQSQKLEAMGQLTSGLAHDFNNLLTIIQGNLDRLSARLPPDLEALRRPLDGARSGAERAAGLTQRLLAFSRRQPPAPRRLDLNELVSGMADLLRQTLGARTLSLDLDPAVPALLADPNSLESALLNLVVNARDATPDGGSVTVATGHGEDRVTLSVADTGSGMSEEIVRRAFEPFFTTKEPGVGTGLGLAQVYGFAKETGGEVAIDSREGVGTVVTLKLPAAVPGG